MVLFAIEYSTGMNRDHYKLTLLETGHAIVKNCYNTCFVLHECGQYFLVDGGGGIGILRQLRNAGTNWKDIKHIFVTISTWTIYYVVVI